MLWFVPSVQQSDSVLYILYQILSHYGLLQVIEYSSHCHTVVPCLSIMYIIVCICQPLIPNPTLHHPHLATTRLFSDTGIF